MVESRGKKRLRRTIRLAQLELLAAMESAATLSGAARNANVTQPSASRLLRTLADDLGIELFEHVGRKLRPTAAGAVLLERARGLVADLDRLQSELEAIDRGFIGTASLGSGMASCYVLVPKAVKILLQAAPRIVVRIREGAMGELTASLREGRIDVLVGRIDDSAGNRDLIIEDLYDPAMTVVCGPQHPLARRRKLTWDDALRQDWILPEAGTPMRTGLESVFRRQRRRPSECLIESSSIQANIGLLNTNDLFWILSADIAHYFENLGVLRIPALPRMRGPSPFVIAYMRDRKLSPAAQRLVVCLRDTALELSVMTPGGRPKIAGKGLSARRILEFTDYR